MRAVAFELAALELVFGTNLNNNNNCNRAITITTEVRRRVAQLFGLVPFRSDPIRSEDLIQSDPIRTEWIPTDPMADVPN